MNPLLRTIIDNPSDTGARLAYTDWLMERGDPLGEFIAVQCEIATLPEPEHKTFVPLIPTFADNFSGQCVSCYELGKHCKYHEKLAIEGALFEVNWWKWSIIVCPWVVPQPAAYDAAYQLTAHVGNISLVFRRGFPAAIHCTLAAWLKHGPAIVAACPIEEARLTDREPWRNPDADLLHWLLCSYQTQSSDIHAEFGYYTRQRRSHLPVLHYTSISAAYADLSHMAVQWARDKAGLPKWEGIS